MARVRVEPSGVEFDTAGDEPVMAAARRAGFCWPTVCDGKGTCRTCFVTVLEGAEYTLPPAPAEREAVADLPAGPRGEPVRLACQLRLGGPVTVRKRGVRPPVADSRAAAAVSTR
jgi:ferredoxin